MMKKLHLYKIQKSLILFTILMLIQGCALHNFMMGKIRTVTTDKTTITIQFDSNPSGAYIFGGKTPFEMRFIGITPRTESFTGVNPYWQEWYYQIKKDGYIDSDVIHSKQLPVNENRTVWAYLEKVQSPPHKSQPVDDNETTKLKTGTAFFINLQGNILSNYHVIHECKIIEVSNTFIKSKAKLLFADIINDLAVLTIDTSTSPSAGYFRSGKDLRIGDDIITIGYPLGPILGNSAKVTKGNISSITGIADNSNMLQFSAPIQPGSSGGPLLDSSGNIVGIVSSKLSEGATLEETGSLPQNVNFAIKSQSVQLFLDSHKVNYLTQRSDKYIETADIVEKADKFTLKVNCLE